MSTVGIRTFTLGPFQTNCYVVAAGGSCWIVDASFDPRAMVEHVRKSGVVPAAIVLTHAHVDHIAGVAEVRAAFAGTGGVPVWVHGAEAAWLNDPVLNLSAMMGMSVTAPGPDRLLAEGEWLTLGDSRWLVLHTPGHSPGGVTLWCEAGGVAIVGDSLFAGSVGRTDFPGSDPAVLERSIRGKLYVLPDSTKVLPGHGPATTIGREKKSNPYVRG